ncbi:MAG: hypothetical protein MPN21_04990 [Thermoanaerobaculia bacterium]|nr:hypothetical protein [Thermoanaerobaculia bacterium]
MTDQHNPFALPPTPKQDPVHNPYAPPTSQLGGPSDAIEHAESIRRDHLSHEASLRSVGCLYYWGGIVALVVAGLSAVGAAAMVFLQEPTGEGLLLLAMTVGLYGFIGWLSVWIGRGLRNLDPKIRTILTILMIIGLLGVPMGTLFGSYVLYLLHSAKGKRILTEEYQRIVEQTPDLEYETPLWLWFLLVLLVLGVVIAVVSSV